MLRAKLFAIDGSQLPPRVELDLGNSSRLRSDENLLVVPFENDVALYDLLRRSQSAPIRPLLITTIGFQRFVETCVLLDAVLEDIDVEPTLGSYEADDLKEAILEYQRTGVLQTVWAVLHEIVSRHNVYVDSVRIRLPNPHPKALPRIVRVSLHSEGILTVANGEATLQFLDVALSQAAR